MGRRRDTAVRLLSGAVLAAAAVPRLASAEGTPDLFSLRPSLGTTLVVDDNPKFEKSGGETAVGAWFHPRVQVDYDSPRLDLGADLGADVRRYAGYDTSLYKEFARMSGWGEYRFTPGLSLRLGDAWVPRAQRLGRPEDDTKNLVQTNLLDGTLRHWQSLPGGRELEMGVQGASFRTESYAEPLDGGTVDSEFRASYTDGLGYVELQTPIAGEVRGFVRAQGGYRFLLDDSDADHADVGGSLGVVIPFDGGALELAGGGGWLDFAGLPDRPRALGRARLRLDLPAGFVSTFGATQLLSANLAGRKVLETDARVELERWFGRRTAASVALFGTRYDDASLAGVDLFGGVEAGVRRQLTRAIQLVVRYRHWSNGGDLGSDDFSQNRGTVELHFQPSML
jgi:hypothetical protein